MFFQFLIPTLTCLALGDTAQWRGPRFGVACDTEPRPSALPPLDAMTDYSGSSSAWRLG